MTLPHGFGATGRCTECGRHLYNKPCRHCNPPAAKVNMPITKRQFGLGIWYGFLSCFFIWALLVPNAITITIFVCVWGFGQLILGLVYLDSYYDNRVTWKELMPWWIPFYAFVKLFSGGGRRNNAGGIANKFKWKEYEKESND